MTIEERRLLKQAIKDIAALRDRIEGLARKLEEKRKPGRPRNNAPQS